MRWMVWWCVGGLVACGESAKLSAPDSEVGAGGESTGGMAGMSSGSGGSFTRAGSGGAPVSGAAGQGASGRAGAASGGTAGATSGGSAGVGAGDAGDAGRMSGQGGTSAEAGAGSAGVSGEGGAPASECGGRYDACGCGCCAAEPTTASCYYPELGEDLDAIRSEDEAVASSPDCANAGCSSGLRYHCCVEPTSNDNATYETSTYIGAFNRVTISRTSEDTTRCTRFTIVESAGGREQFRISVSERWAVEVASDYACEDESSAIADSRRSPIGGLGEVRWTQSTPDGCNLSLDVSLFFPAESGGVDAVRFEAEDLTISESAFCG